MKKVIQGKDSIQEVKKGLDIACNAIRNTIGPNGRNTFIDHEMQPFITNDGVSTANAITLEGMPNLGVWLVKNTCGKTFDDVGDATTTTASLLQAIINESLERPENPIKIRRSLKQEGREVVRLIEKESKPIKDKQIVDVATIATENKVIGQLIADVINKAGKKTPVYIEERYDVPEIDFVVSEGLETKCGYISSNNPVVELADVSIVVTDKRIDSIMQIQVILQTLDEQQITSPVFIVPDMDELAYRFFMKVNEKGAFNYNVIRAKGNDIYDMAAVCGATVISTINGLDFKDFKPSHFGKAKKIVITDKKTLITAEDSEIRQKAIKRLQTQALNTKNTFEQQALNRRAEALVGGVAVIRVGAPTDTERTDLKLKILNGVNTTRTALEEGIVEGGGMTLYRIANKLKGKSIGNQILRKALKQPLRDIIENSGEDFSEVAKRITKHKGYNAETNKIEDLYKNGVIDSAKSTRCAFINALSTASEFITVGVAVTEQKNETSKS